MLGLFPFIAAFLFDLGETTLSIAGIVIAGFAVGGLFYTMTVSRFLPRIGVNGMMITGGALVGVQLVAMAMGPEWKLQTLGLIFMGWGFYMIHGSLQVFASELSAEARASALSLHAFFFFMGQTIGPIAYGFGIQHAGKVADLADSSGDHDRARLCLRETAAPDPAGGCGGNVEVGGRLRVMAGQRQHDAHLPGVAGCTGAGQVAADGMRIASFSPFTW